MNVVKKQGFFKSLFSSTKVPEEYFSPGNTTMDNFLDEQSRLLPYEKLFDRSGYLCGRCDTGQGIR